MGRKSKTEIVKKLLKDMFDHRAWWKGRTWGLFGKKTNPCSGRNPFGGSHTAVGIDREWVTVVASGDGEVIVYEFVLTIGTSLGKEVKEILRQGGVSFEEGYEFIKRI